MKVLALNKARGYATATDLTTFYQMLLGLGALNGTL